MIEEPEHHKRYRVVWESYVDPDCPEHCKEMIESELARLLLINFNADEFNKFSKTIDGYEEALQELCTQRQAGWV